MHRYFNDYRWLPMRPFSLDFRNPHVFHFKKDKEDMSEVMLKYGGSKQIYYCPDNPEDRNPGTWWPYRTGTVAATYQFPFWMNEASWFIEYPDYRRLSSERFLAGDICASSDGSTRVIEANHVNQRNGLPRGQNMLFGDGHVVWNDASKGWVLYAWFGAVEFWHYAQYD